MLSLHIFCLVIKKSMKKFINKIPSGLLSLITFVVIIYVSLDNNPFEINRVQLFEGADKIIHALMYGFFVMVMIYESSKYLYFEESDFISYILLFMMAFLFSVAMELLQELMEIGRHMDIYDIIANTSGIILGILAMKFGLLAFIERKLYTDYYE